MPRQPRTVFANIPHHITQRGNRKQDVFFTDTDKDYYLELLEKYTKKHNVAVIAYCLMSNHVHLILLPETTDGLQKVLKPLHMRYSQYVNKTQGWSGILWQGRYFSSPLDEFSTYQAIRYVENNPVKAKMVTKAREYKYSSAQYHVGQIDSGLLNKYDIGIKVGEHDAYLAEACNINFIKQLKINTQKGLPSGEDSFIAKLSKKVGRSLKQKSIGRPRKE